MPAPQWFLCAAMVPPRDGRKELSLAPASCWADLRVPELALLPTRASGVQRGPGLTAEGKKGSRLGRGILFSMSVGAPWPSETGQQERPEGPGRSWGAAELLPRGAATASHRLPGLGGRRPRGQWQVCGGGVPGPRSPAVSSRRPRPPRLGGADPGPGRFVPPPPYKAAFVARGLRRTR